MQQLIAGGEERQQRWGQDVLAVQPVQAHTRSTLDVDDTDGAQLLERPAHSFDAALAAELVHLTTAQRARGA